jgi:hypothetical protein
MMASPRQFSRIAQGRQLGFAVGADRFGLQSIGAGGAAPTVIQKDASDPKGLKILISFDVSHAIYPQGNSVDPNQSIANDTASNSDIRAAQINLDAQLGALKFGYIWTLVVPFEVGRLKIVGELMDLIVSHLA